MLNEDLASLLLPIGHDTANASYDPETFHVLHPALKKEDSPTIFSLLHECVHVIQHSCTSTGIHDVIAKATRDQNVETFIKSASIDFDLYPGHKSWFGLYRHRSSPDFYRNTVRSKDGLSLQAFIDIWYSNFLADRFRHDPIAVAKLAKRYDPRYEDPFVALLLSQAKQLVFAQHRWAPAFFDPSEDYTFDDYNAQAFESYIKSQQIWWPGSAEQKVLSSRLLYEAWACAIEMLHMKRLGLNWEWLKRYQEILNSEYKYFFQWVEKNFITLVGVDILEEPLILLDLAIMCELALNPRNAPFVKEMFSEGITKLNPPSRFATLNKHARVVWDTIGSPKTLGIDEIKSRVRTWRSRASFNCVELQELSGLQLKEQYKGRLGYAGIELLLSYKDQLFSANPTAESVTEIILSENFLASRPPLAIYKYDQEEEYTFSEQCFPSQEILIKKVTEIMYYNAMKDLVIGFAPIQCLIGGHYDLEKNIPGLTQFVKKQITRLTRRQ
ncbi:MAG: hypothetical protein EPO10_00845 [Reyranella sp.]|uniref:hypothetical protein n=1 Tax=Reyranella sp. TaxID=1929291 RepID=UPI00121936F4|nr:hypothetical protein [Reyranella sp.]TAJ97442.1 MAG: hypothetical protein EPO41_03285 [Reyranella sp.]TBR30836.1 MAG: hypothetical protein EPO10_00845 [Reyranella sp.]